MGDQKTKARATDVERVVQCNTQTYPVGGCVYKEMTKDERGGRGAAAQQNETALYILPLREREKPFMKIITEFGSGF